MSRTVIPDLRDDEADIAGLDEAVLLVCRANFFGCDLGVADFGGGAAEVDAADRLTGEAVKARWVEDPATTSARWVVEVEVEVGDAVSFAG